MIDIKYDGSDTLASRLSNFQPRDFEFDGIKCVSIESVLQAFKVDDTNVQKTMCCKSAKQAQRTKKSMRLDTWQRKQQLYWGGVMYQRGSKEYQVLLVRLYAAVIACDPSFLSDLIETGREELQHTIGKSSQCLTVLTDWEFCIILMRLRDCA